MLQRSIVLSLAATFVVLIMLTSTAASTTTPKRIPGITLLVRQGGWLPSDYAHPGQMEIYDIYLNNTRSVRIPGLTFEVTFPKQKVSLAQLILPPEGVQKSARITGANKNHMTWVIQGIGPSYGLELKALVRVLKTARGQICNKYIVRVGGKRADYSNVWGVKNPCTRIRK